MNTLDVTSPASAPAERRFKIPRLKPENRQSYILLGTLLGCLVVYLLISHFIMMRVDIQGASMWPTLLDGQRYMLYRCPYLWRAPRQGEIVVIRDPEDHGLSIKRIIGVPNQVVEIKRDGVYVDHVKLHEPYLTALNLWASGHKTIEARTLKPNEYFVLGDNRDYSADSRRYGPVPRNLVLGLISRPD
jgi:signal peptidase I